MFNFFKKLSSLFSSASNKKLDFYTFWIECQRCKEIVKVSVNLKTDLINQFKEVSQEGPAYKLRKEVLGNNCPNLMELNADFDENRHLISIKVKFGKLVKQEVGKF